ncbi:MAG: ATP-dependent 6-phosphofructokinase [Candidatus Omnitrophica bacterium]|nr:ATP-dependent 6-phosphofructokinase [Candidatus Omnitrophota bacterium]
MQKIGILTGGGDCPGLNPVIRAVVARAAKEGWEVIGFKDGWKGIIENKTMPLDRKSTREIIDKGGTILGTSRTNPYKKEGAVKKIVETFKANNLTALIAVGGEDTLGVANKLVKEEKLNVVGVPKTIDNDLNSTDYTFGFDTAVNVAMECIDRLKTTSESHHRVMVVEIMGRHAGWITLTAGVAGGADVILIPEVPINIDEVCAILKKRHEEGKLFGIVAVAEGAKVSGKDVTQEVELDQFGHVRLGGIGERLAKVIEEKTGYETRYVVLGHIQRGGHPTAFDRMLGSRFGVKAVELVIKKEFGKMVSLQGAEIVAVSLEAAVKELKTVPPALFEVAKIVSES